MLEKLWEEILTNRDGVNMNYRNKEMLNKGALKGYICTCCGSETSLNNSVSYRGSNLVCYPCIYKMKRVLGVTVSQVIMQIQKVGARHKFD